MDTPLGSSVSLRGIRPAVSDSALSDQRLHCPTADRIVRRSQGEAWSTQVKMGSDLPLFPMPPWGMTCRVRPRRQNLHPGSDLIQTRTSSTCSQLGLWPQDTDIVQSDWVSPLLPGPPLHVVRPRAVRTRPGRSSNPVSAHPTIHGTRKSESPALRNHLQE